MLQTQEFFDKKKQTESKIDLAKSSAFRSGGLGKIVPEKILQSSRDEHEYFKKSNKIFTKDLLKESEYKRQIPDYLRLMEDPSKLHQASTI